MSIDECSDNIRKSKQLDAEGRSRLLKYNMESPIPVIEHDDLTIQPSSKAQNGQKKVKQSTTGKAKKRVDSLSTLRELLKDNPTLHQRIIEAVVFDEETETYVIRSPRVEQREGISRRQFRQLALFHLETILAATSAKISSDQTDDVGNNNPSQAKSTNVAHRDGLNIFPRSGKFPTVIAHNNDSSTHDAGKIDANQIKKNDCVSSSSHTPPTRISRSSTMSHHPTVRTAARKQQIKNAKVKTETKVMPIAKIGSEGQNVHIGPTDSDWLARTYPDDSMMMRVTSFRPPPLDTSFFRPRFDAGPGILDVSPHSAPSGYTSPYYDTRVSDQYGHGYEPWNAYPNQRDMEDGRMEGNTRSEGTTPLARTMESVRSMDPNTSVRIDTVDGRSPPGYWSHGSGPRSSDGGNPLQVTVSPKHNSYYMPSGTRPRTPNPHGHPEYSYSPSPSHVHYSNPRPHPISGREHRAREIHMSMPPLAPPLPSPSPSSQHHHPQHQQSPHQSKYLSTRDYGDSSYKPRYRDQYTDYPHPQYPHMRHPPTSHATHSSHPMRTSQIRAHPNESRTWEGTFSSSRYSRVQGHEYQTHGGHGGHRTHATRSGYTAAGLSIGYAARDFHLDFHPNFPRTCTPTMALSFPNEPRDFPSTSNAIANRAELPSNADTSLYSINDIASASTMSQVSPMMHSSRYDSRMAQPGTSVESTSESPFDRELIANHHRNFDS